MKLPQAFSERMKNMLGEEYETFLAAYDREPCPALRLNPRKCPEDFSLFCPTEPVPWARYGYYYHANESLRPGKHPYHEAGVYYMQEASAMLPAALCPPSAGDRVLDLCAAPGGKTTQLSAALGEEGLLVSNEIHPKRAAVLSQNVERMGICNAVVTCHAPHELAEHFPSFFHKIVVDAPCSGEGMFRKEEQALEMWSEENVRSCPQRQKEILESAARMLSPDGYLTYSTCTFAPEENEGVILAFLKKHPEFEVVESENPAVLACVEQGLLDRGEPAWVEGGEEYADALRKTLRVFPHHCRGEGHFAALLHKKADAPCFAAFTRSETKKKPRETKSATDLKQAVELWEAFLSQTGCEAFRGTPCLFGEQLILCPEQLPSPVSRLRTLRHGLQAGEIVNGRRFEPSHSLALALRAGQIKNTFAVDEVRARAYLRGEVLPCDKAKGWYLITLDGFALGWGKADGTMMKNHYPKGLRKNG